MPKTGREKDQKPQKISPKWDAEARAECLYPAQHSLQHINKKLLRTQIRERCLRQTIRRESAEEECDERVLLDGRARKKMRRRQMCVEIEEHRSGCQHSPSGASGPGANFGCLRQWFRPRASLGWIPCDGVLCFCFNP